MAIDPSISLAVRPPVIPPLQIQSPLEQFAKVLSLRNLMTENQSGQIGLQTQQLGLQERQRGIQEDETLRQQYAKGTPTDAEIISIIGPTRALPLIKSKYEQVQQFYKTEGDRYGLLGRIAGSATDKASGIDAVMRATASKAFDADPTKNAEIGRQMLDHLNTNGFNLDEFKGFGLRAMEAEKQAKALLDAADEKRKAALAPFELSEKQSKAEQGALQTAGQNAQLLSDASQIPDFIAALPSADLQQRFKNLSALPLAEFKRYAGMAAGAPKPGETIPLPADVQQQKVEQQAAIGLATEQAKQGFQNTQNESLVRAVMNDQTGGVYASMPAEKQKEIAPILAQRGWTQFAAKPSDTELTKMQDIQKAIGIANSLKSTLADKSDLIGPGSGRLTALPYAIERKKLQADIDLARQIIGKGLEGGVLRKEDEEKYKNILPTMIDPPEVAQSKLTKLQELLTRDLGTYRQSLKGAGRQLPDTTVQGPPAASGQAPAGSTPALKQSKPGDEPKMVWFGPDGKEYSKPPVAAPANNRPTANPNPSGYIPGHVYGGMTYLGGDPKDRASWR